MVDFIPCNKTHHHNQLQDFAYKHHVTPFNTIWGSLTIETATRPGTGDKDMANLTQAKAMFL